MYFTNFVGMGYGMGNIGLFVVLLVAWNLFWKGLALWHSAKKHQGWWFIILLVINTVGILEIIYLFGVLKLKSSELLPKGRQ